MRNHLPSNYKILIHHKMLRKTPETIKRFGCVTLVTILVLEKNYCFACTDMGLHLSVGVGVRASQTYIPPPQVLEKGRKCTKY
jgi:hypothetical protein